MNKNVGFFQNKKMTTNVNLNFDFSFRGQSKKIIQKQIKIIKGICTLIRFSLRTNKNIQLKDRYIIR